jgi:hypothetical protein
MTDYANNTYQTATKLHAELFRLETLARAGQLEMTPDDLAAKLFDLATVAETLRERLKLEDYLESEEGSGAPE